MTVAGWVGSGLVTSATTSSRPSLWLARGPFGKNSSTRVRALGYDGLGGRGQVQAELWVFVPAFEFGRDRPDGGFGNALLTRLPILAVQQWQLLWPPRLYDGSEPSEARSVLLARVQQMRAPFWAGITHLPRQDGQALTDALRRLATLTGSLTEPWLICGDFNTAASSWPGHDKAVVASPAKLTYPVHEPAEPIDYCLASAAFRLDAEVLPGAASDHLPLLISARQTR